MGNEPAKADPDQFNIPTPYFPDQALNLQQAYVLLRGEVPGAAATETRFLVRVCSNYLNNTLRNFSTSQPISKNLGQASFVPFAVVLTLKNLSPKTNLITRNCFKPP